MSVIRERNGKIMYNIIRVSAALFFLTPGAARSFFSGKSRKERMGGAYSRLWLLSNVNKALNYTFPLFRKNLKKGVSSPLIFKIIVWYNRAVS